MSIRSLYPDIRPSLLLDFANAKQLDPRITFTRTSTATYVGRNGLIKTAGIGQPRFDHDPVTGESLGLLIEESRTNYVAYSENFTTWWTLGAIGSVTANSTTSPDGNNNGTLLTNTGPSPMTINNQTVYYGGQIFRSSFAGPDTGTHTWSLFAKAKECDIISIIANTIGGARQSYFDLENGTVFFAPSDVTAIIEPYPNGWYKCSVSWDQGTSVSYTYNIQVFSKTEITGSDGIYIWGAQLEKGSFPTSYIPTSGSSATRAKDDALITGGSFESWINKNEGTWLIDFRTLGSGSGLLSISATGGSVHERYMMLNIATDGIFSAAVVDGGVLQTNESILFTPTQTAQFTKAIFAVKDNDFAITANGLTPVTDTSGTVYNSPTQLRFAYGDGSSTPYAHFKTCIYYPKRLTNAQLQTLTK